ncbi:hypothetical protein LTR28_009343 [Elasticomyces elasticus]|nr:hypothetical protein LTR28_009343 [Elasticomyces elasticus]
MPTLHWMFHHVLQPFGTAAPSRGWSVQVRDGMEDGDLRSRRSAKSDGDLVVDTSYATAENRCQQLDEIDIEPPISSPASSISGVLVDTDDTLSGSSTTSGVLITPPELDDACTDWSDLGGVPLTPSLTDDIPGEWTLIDHPRTQTTDYVPTAISASDTPASPTLINPYRLRVGRGGAGGMGGGWLGGWAGL